jgi:NAD(P)-dependent dehydrogenase (short-subunit alcohol dehydrogenase family)
MAGSVVLISGAGGAVGRRVVKTVLAAGHGVVAVDRVRLDTRASTDQIADAEDRLHVLEGDALAPDFMEHAASLAESRFGHLDALFHLAGTYAYAPLADTDLDLWQRVLDANFTSAFVAARAVLPALRTSRGVMVFVGAQAAISAPANQSAYNASKAGLMTFVRSLSQELRPDGIRVNCIVPYIIDTPANRKSMANSDTSRWLTIDQVADVLLYLVSSDAAAITGAAITLQRS